jgi:hypothetical protein
MGGGAGGALTGMSAAEAICVHTTVAMVAINTADNRRIAGPR